MFVYISTLVISNNNIFKCYFSLIFLNNVDIFFSNKLIETDIRLVDERCVTSVIGNLQRLIIDIDTYFHFFHCLTLEQLHPPPHNIVLMCIL